VVHGGSALVATPVVDVVKQVNATPGPWSGAYHRRESWGVPTAFT